MAKTASYVCQSCGATHAKWSGKCEACGGWNTITEEGAAPPLGSGASRRAKGRKITLEDLKSEDAPPPRRPTGIAEFDRVTGGGLVPGSALLVGGDPGIGKSTIILQALGKYAQNGGHAIYISGEEAMAQVRMRAARMGLSDAPLMLGAATNVEDILATLEAGKPPAIVAIDSIQTLWTGALDAAPGTIAQVRTASFDLVRYAKGSGAALLRGPCHQGRPDRRTQSGRASGGCGALFEGERGHHFRVLQGGEEPFRRHRRDRRVRNDRQGWPKSPIRRRCFWATANPPRRAPRCSRDWKARGPSCVKSRRWCRACAYGTPRRAVVGWDTGAWP